MKLAFIAHGFLQQIRLQGGANPFEGWVEVSHDGSWGTICSDGWGIEEAMTVCRQLNLGYAGKAVTQNTFGQTNHRIVMSGVKCRVDEISIYNCQHSKWQNVTCSSDENVAGVVCVNGKVKWTPKQLDRNQDYYCHQWYHRHTTSINPSY